MAEDRELLMRCACGCNMIILHETIEDQQLEYEFIFYEAGVGNTTSIWSRVKYAFRYIFTGKGFTSSIILSDEDIKKVKKFIK